MGQPSSSTRNLGIDGKTKEDRGGVSEVSLKCTVIRIAARYFVCRVGDYATIQSEILVIQNPFCYRNFAISIRVACAAQGFDIRAKRVGVSKGIFFVDLIPVLGSRGRVKLRTMIVQFGRKLILIRFDIGYLMGS